MELVAQPQQQWKFGTQERVDRGTPIVLWASLLANVAAARYSTFRLAGTQAGYQVPAGSTLVLTKLYFNQTVTDVACSFGYSDADLGLNAAADGANPVDLDAASAIGLGRIGYRTYWDFADEKIYYEIPAEKYPRLGKALGDASLFFVQLHGYLR